MSALSSAVFLFVIFIFIVKGFHADVFLLQFWPPAVYPCEYKDEKYLICLGIITAINQES